MGLLHIPEDHASLAKRRGEITTRIGRLLLIRSLVGTWTPQRRAEYVALCEEERTLMARMGERMEARI